MLYEEARTLQTLGGSWVLTTVNPKYQSTCNLLRGLRGLISTLITGVISFLNLQRYPPWELFFVFVYIKPKRILTKDLFIKVLRGVYAKYGWSSSGVLVSFSGAQAREMSG